MIIKCKQRFFVPFRQFVFSLVLRHNDVGETGQKRALNLIWIISLPASTYNIIKLNCTVRARKQKIRKGVSKLKRKWKKWKPINTTAKATRLELWRERLEPLDARVHLDISADEHLPAGAENPWTTWKALNRLRTQVGRSRVNMSKWGFSNEPETCDCGIRQTMQHLLVCPMMDTACSPQDLTTANDIAIGCARHWEDTIWLTCTTPGGRTRMVMTVSRIWWLLI